MQTSLTVIVPFFIMYCYPQPHVPTRQLPMTKAGTMEGTTTSTTSTSTKKRKAPPVAAAASKKPTVAMSSQKQSKPKSRKAPPAGSKKPAFAVPKGELWALKMPSEPITWETRYEQLVHFQKGHGHCRVPVRCSKVPGLATWVSRQRSMNKDIALRMHYQQQGGGGDTGTDTNNEARASEAVNNNNNEASNNNDPTIPLERLQRFEKLNQIGFHWLLFKDPPPSFDERFQDLVAFKQEFGHCRVTRTHSLGEWVHNLRREYKKQGRLAVQERVPRLLELGFEFSVKAPLVTWEQRLEQLMEFRRKYGHVNVFEVHRQAVKDNDMGGSIGDGINKHEDEDNDNDDNEDKEGTASSHLVENDFLRWVETQQRSYWTAWKLGKKCRLNKIRIRQLEEMGFDFGPERQPHAKGRMGRAHKGPNHHRTTNVAYSSRLEQLRQYKARHNDCLVPKEWPENPQLGSWVASQRKQYRALLNGKPSGLTKDRRVELESMGFVWVVRPWNLKENRKRKDVPQQDDATVSSSGEGSE
jgi:hypothetical protein